MDQIIKSKVNSSVEHVLASLGTTNFAINEIVEKMNRKRILIAIDYESPMCEQCKNRKDKLKKLGDNIFVLSYNIKSNVNHLVKVKE